MDGMPKLLATLQEANNESRKRAEAAFTQFSTNNPIECARALLACLESEEAESNRALAAVLLRRFAKQEKEDWGAEAICGWRQALWNALQAERGQTASRLLCDAVAAEASSSSSSPWPEACRSAGETLCRTDANSSSEKKKSLLLLRALAREGDSTTLAAAEALASAVARCCETRELARSSVACAASLAVRVSTPGYAIANELAPACLAACSGFLERRETDDAAACLDALVEVAGDAPAFFSASSRQALALGRAIASCNQLEIETRGRGLDLACAICSEEATGVDSEDVSEVVRVAFATAAEDTGASDACWAREPCPRRPLLAEDDDDEPQAASLGDAALRSLAASVAPEVVAPPLLKCVEQAHVANGGRFRRAALAGLTALALGSPESLEAHVEPASALIFSALSDFKNAGPRETIEACRLAAALSVSLRRTAASHLALGLPAALAPVIFDARLASPRLCGAACAALALAATGDDEEDDYDEFEDGGIDDAGSAAYATAIAGALAQGGLSQALAAALFETTDTYARFAALDAVAQAAVAAGSDFALCYPHFVPAIASAAGGADAEVRARAILCAATCGTAVGADLFRPEAKIVFAALLKDAEATPTDSDRSPSDDDDEDIADSDLLFGTLMPAAVQLCGLFGTEDWFSINLEGLVRPVLVAASATPEIVADREDALSAAFGGDRGGARKEADGHYSLAVDDVRVTVDLRAMWAKQKAADVLGDVVDALDSAAPENLILSAADALAPLTTFAGSSLVRANASLSLAQVVEAAVQKFRVDATRKVMAASISRRAALACTTALDAETRPEARVDHCRGLANVLDHVLNASPGGYETNPPDVFASLFTDTDVETMATSLLKHAVKSRDRRGEEKEEEATNAEIDLQTQLVNALGCLSKLGRPSFVPVFDSVVAPFFLGLLGQLDDDRYAGLCVLMDAVDRLPGAAEKYGNQVLATALDVLANADRYESDFLATAAFAVAVVARRTQRVPQKHAIAALLKRLLDDDSLSRRVTDNCVQALYELDSNTFLDTWLEKLPLTADLEEARRANKYLLHILENDPKQYQVVVVARLADALADYDESEFPEPPTTTLDKRTHDQIILRLQALSQQAPQTLQAAYRTLEQPSQAAIVQACEQKVE